MDLELGHGYSGGGGVWGLFWINQQILSYFNTTHSKQMQFHKCV